MVHGPEPSPNQIPSSQYPTLRMNTWFTGFFINLNLGNQCANSTSYKLLVTVYGESKDLYIRRNLYANEITF
jgi:hypothetical protein